MTLNTSQLRYVRSQAHTDWTILQGLEWRQVAEAMDKERDTSLGTLGYLPWEIREMIYTYCISDDRHENLGETYSIRRSVVTQRERNEYLPGYSAFNGYGTHEKLCCSRPSIFNMKAYTVSLFDDKTPSPSTLQMVSPTYSVRRPEEGY